MSATVGEVAARSLVGEGVESSWLEGTSWQKAPDASRDKGMTMSKLLTVRSRSSEWTVPVRSQYELRHERRWMWSEARETRGVRDWDERRYESDLQRNDSRGVMNSSRVRSRGESGGESSCEVTMSFGGMGSGGLPGVPGVDGVEGGVGFTGRDPGTSRDTVV